MKKLKKYISKNSKIALGATVDKTCLLEEENQINKHAQVSKNSVLKNVILGENSSVENSTLEDCQIGKNVKIGPYSRIRKNTIIEDDCKIGNFVEIKESTLKKGTKAAHLAYIGNAEIGENCNIGAGVVFANYNGKEKNKIVLGNNCFIGSNSTLVAPITLGDNCFVAAGSVVTESAPANTLIIGRAFQVNKENRAQNYLKGTNEKWNILEQTE